MSPLTRPRPVILVERADERPVECRLSSGELDGLTLAAALRDLLSNIDRRKKRSDSKSFLITVLSGIGGSLVFSVVSEDRRVTE